MPGFFFIAAVVLLGDWAVRQLARDIRGDYRKRVKHGSHKKASKTARKNTGKRRGRTKRGKPAKSTTFGVKAAAVTGAAVHGGWLAGKGIVQGWRSEWPNAKKRAHDRWARKHTPPEAKTPPPVDPRVAVKVNPEPAPKSPAQSWPPPPTAAPPPIGLNKPQQNGEPVATASKPTPGEVQSYEQVKSALKQIVADAGAEMDDAKAADARLNAEITNRDHLANRLAALKIDAEVVKLVSQLSDSAKGWQQTAKARIPAAERDLNIAQGALKALESSAQARFYQN